VSGDPFSALAQGKSGRRVGAERYFATIFTQKCSTTCETPDCERFWWQPRGFSPCSRWWTWPAVQSPRRCTPSGVITGLAPPTPYLGNAPLLACASAGSTFI